MMELGFKSAKDIELDKTNFQMGNVNIYLNCYGPQKSDLLFFNMHDNENTASKAGKFIVKNKGQNYSELVHGGHRLVLFKYNDEYSGFDPNRIFTDDGLVKTLNNYGHYSEEVFGLVKNFRDGLLSELNFKGRQLIVGLHDNPEGDYSIHNYLGEDKDKKSAKEVNYVVGSKPDNFYLVLNDEHYQVLSDKGYNVVLLDPNNMQDEGSLSYYCAKNKLPFINIEVESGDLENAKNMCSEIYNLIE